MPEGESSGGVPGRDEYPKGYQCRLVLDPNREIEIGGELQLRVMRTPSGELAFCLPNNGVEQWHRASGWDQFLLGFDPDSVEALKPWVQYGASVPLTLRRVLDSRIDKVE